MIKSKTFHLIVFLNFLVFASVFLLLMYFHTFTVNRTNMFNMTSKHLIFQKSSNEDIFFSDVIDLETDNNVLIIGYEKGLKQMGIYDPRYIHAFHNVVFENDTRYFSYSDYKNYTNTAIGLLSSNLSSQTCDDLKSYYSNYTILYCSFDSSLLSGSEEVEIIFNLASMSSLPKTLYVDYKNYDEVESLTERLISAGYQLDTSHIVSLKQLFFEMQFFQLGLFFMFATITIFSLLGIVYFWHIHNLRKTLIIHFNHGGTFIKMLWHQARFLILANVISLFVLLFGGQFYRKIQYLLFSDFELLIFSVFLLMLSLIVFIISFSFVYGIVIRFERDKGYVK